MHAFIYSSSVFSRVMLSTVVPMQESLFKSLLPSPVEVQPLVPITSLLTGILKHLWCKIAGRAETY